MADFLKNTVPGWRVYDAEDKATVSWFYRIDDHRGDIRHTVHVARAVLVDNDGTTVTRLLERWNVAARIREAGTRRVVITNDGVNVSGEGD